MGEERTYSLFAPKNSGNVLVAESDQAPQLLTVLKICQQLEGLEGKSTANLCHVQKGVH